MEFTDFVIIGLLGAAISYLARIHSELKKLNVKE